MDYDAFSEIVFNKNYFVNGDTICKSVYCVIQDR